MEFNHEQLDALKEIINIGVGRAADSLNRMLNSHIILQVPDIKIVATDQLFAQIQESTGENITITSIEFNGTISGKANLIFSTDKSVKLVKTIIESDEETDEFNQIKKEVISEIGNMVINGVIGTISNLTKMEIDYSIPEYIENPGNDIFKLNQSETIVLLARTQFTVRVLKTEGYIIIFLNTNTFDSIINDLINSSK